MKKEKKETHSKRGNWRFICKNKCCRPTTSSELYHMTHHWLLQTTDALNQHCGLNNNILTCVRNVYCLFDDKGCSLLLCKRRNMAGFSPKLRFVLIIHNSHSSAHIRYCFSIINLYICTTKHHLYNVLKILIRGLRNPPFCVSDFQNIFFSLCSWRWVSVTRKWSWE
jgi:hypothetical protein